MSIPRKDKKIHYTKRSSYVLALIDYADLDMCNAISIIDSKMYVIPREKTDETDALLAVQLHVYLEILQNAYILNEDNIDKCVCEYVLSIRNHFYLNYIVDSHRIYTKYSYTVNRIVNQLIQDGWDDQYILLNIEPKGLTSELERLYPAPLITLPGGTMETMDKGDFEKCAFREFYEETNIRIDKCSHICIAKDKLKCSKHQTTSQFDKKHHKTKQKEFQVSWFFSLKLIGVTKGMSWLH